MKPLILTTLVFALTLSAAETPKSALLVLNKEGNLAIVDPTSGQVVGRVPTGEGPHEVTASTDGRLAFVSNYGAGTTLSVIHEVTASTDGRLAFVSNYGAGTTLSVIDLVAQKELHRVDLGPLRRPHGVFYAGGKLYFTAEVNKLVARYDPAANQIDWLLGTGQNSTHMVLVNKDLTQIFTANIGSDSISVLERGSNPQNWTQTVIPVGKGPEAIDMSPDGKQIWTAHSRDGGVSIIDIASKKVIQTLDVHTKRSNRLKFTPDGKLVLISDLDAGELVILDVATRKEAKRMKLGRSPRRYGLGGETVKESQAPQRAGVLGGPLLIARQRHPAGL